MKSMMSLRMMSLSLVVSLVQPSSTYEYCPPTKPLHTLKTTQTTTTTNDISSYKLRETDQPDCRPEIGKKEAGFPLNVNSRCMLDKKTNEFYQLITWDPPYPVQTPVSAYVLKIEYGVEAIKYCFRLNTTKFKFYKSAGFIYRCPFYFHIAAQPIEAKLEPFPSFNISDECPGEPNVQPLGSASVPLGSTWSFTCRFKYPPYPIPNITWYHSKDNSFCKDPQPVVEGLNHISVSADRTALTVKRVTSENVGCYAVSVDNGIGPVRWERGYLRTNETFIIHRKGHPLKSPFVRIIAGSIAGVAVIAMIVAIKIFGYTGKGPRHRKHVDAESSTKHKIYISHCMESDDEKRWLTKFASLLTSRGMAVILDICSEVQINMAGGLARWIPSGMKEADTILVVLTQRYAAAMECYQPVYDNDNDCGVVSNNDGSNDNVSSSNNDANTNRTWNSNRRMENTNINQCNHYNNNNQNNSNSNNNNNNNNKNNHNNINNLIKSQENVLKVHCECNFMRNVLFENVEGLSELVVLCKGVGDLPHVFKDKKIVTCATEISRIKEDVSQVTCLVAKREAERHQLQPGEK